MPVQHSHAVGTGHSTCRRALKRSTRSQPSPITDSASGCDWHKLTNSWRHGRSSRPHTSPHSLNWRYLSTLQPSPSNRVANYNNQTNHRTACMQRAPVEALDPRGRTTRRIQVQTPVWGTACRQCKAGLSFSAPCALYRQMQSNPTAVCCDSLHSLLCTCVGTRGVPFQDFGVRESNFMKK